MSDSGPGIRPPRIRADTIVAVGTAPGRSALAVIRVSGPEAESICRRVVCPWPARAREACLCVVHQTDDRSERLDLAMVTVFEAPRTYTGEPLVEISTHGGTYVPRAVCAALVGAGARPAAPGEFTERAVLAGKLDLLRAEAIADLIDARSRSEHRLALHQMSGALSRRLGTLRASLVNIEALLAYEIDFPEEDDGPVPRSQIAGAATSALEQLDGLLATAPAAILGREGAAVVLAGPPNAGKSSLLNAIVGEERVIVSDSPGTTRDAIEVMIEHEPWPLRFIDTAGLRDSGDPVEKLGIAVSKRYLGTAHAVVACAESERELRATIANIGALTSAPIIGAWTKSDLYDNSVHASDFAVPVVRVSALRGEGIGQLLREITRGIGEVLGDADQDTPPVTRARHRGALETARSELGAFHEAWVQELLPAPVASAHVKRAIQSLDELVGSVDVDEILAQVFATFCVGK